MKFNMGCGFNKLPGYVNVDMFPECTPDLLTDLEHLPWPIETGRASEVVFNHCLEHLGQHSGTFLGIMKELYRICKPGARIVINAPHPRHDHFLGDPTHVRAITPEVLSLFSKKNCRYWSENGFSNSPLALYLDVDFEVTGFVKVLDEVYQKRLESGELSGRELDVMARERNNVVKENRFELVAVK
jgi:hypothetical protein